MVVIYTSSELEKIRVAGKIVAKVHKELKQLIEPGITTEYLDKVANDIIRSEGAIPAFLGYQGFPFTICASINNEIVHGFPNVRKLKDGDLISIDVGAINAGYYGDAAFSCIVGKGKEETKQLLNASEEALKAAISIIKEGVTTGTIGRVIEEYSRSRGFYVVKNYVGHGIGRQLHMEPAIYNFGRDIEGIKLKTGMCICVEPMLCVGSAENHRLKDGWTVVTSNGKLSCHVEHQIIVHKEYAEVITI